MTPNAEPAKPAKKTSRGAWSPGGRRCSVEGCGRRHAARGYCNTCYGTKRATGELVALFPKRKDDLCVMCQTATKLPRGSYCRPCASAYERHRRMPLSETMNARRRAAYEPERRFFERLRAYGLSPDDFQEMFDRQNGLCAICSEGADLHIDHDHSCCARNLRSCGKCVRGLLCNSCNNGLGRFADSPERLERAATYLRTHAVALSHVRVVEESSVVKS